MGNVRYLAAALVAALTIGGSAPEAAAQTYPSKPVTLIIPYPAGGFVDGLGRIIAKQFGRLHPAPRRQQSIDGCAVDARDTAV
jgi:tripartite-type tricarboxylate transporter receptor subunit TctC